jgi:hypothetical protein
MERKDLEEQRREWRERQSKSRAAKADREHADQLDELRRKDPDAARVLALWAETITQPITKPGVPLPDPGPARLPSLVEWQKFLKSIRQTVAIEKEITRVEAAMAAGLTEFPQQAQGEILRKHLKPRLRTTNACWRKHAASLNDSRGKTYGS